jgi:hypothetical protein
VGTDITFTAGHLFLDTLDAVMGSTGTLTGYDASKYVVTAASGHLVKENFSSPFEFPVGMAVGDYTPATITPAASNTVHVNVTSYASDTLTQINPDGILRTWNIFGNDASGAIISLQHNTTTNQTKFLPTANFVTRYGTKPNSTGDAPSLSAWQINTPGASTAGSVAGSEIRTRVYTTLAIAANTNEAWYTKASSLVAPLPVRLLSFTGVRNIGNDLLNWKAAGEKDFSHYEVEYSPTGKNFTKIGAVLSQHNSNATAELVYTFTHFNVNGKAWYRLKAVDNDQTFTYSNVVLLQGGETHTAATLTVWPVPFTHTLNVAYTATSEGNAQIIITDAVGRRLYQLPLEVKTGSNNLVIPNLEGYASGTYLLSVITEQGEAQTVKITK